MVCLGANRDHSAKVGSQEIPIVIGKFGLGVQNEARKRLTEFCEDNTLAKANTLFQQQKRKLFKKIGDIKGKFHAKMGRIKDKNSKDLREAEEIKKRWQEYIEELYKKGLNDLDNHDGVVTYLELDILECEIERY